jgi:hypothetical protein
MSGVNHVPANSSPVLVTGAHRTGTTWVGKMLAAGPHSAYISEPLNILHRPGVLSSQVEHWYTYICPQNEAQYLPAFRQTLRFRYHLLAEILSLRSLKDAGRMGRDAGIFLRGRLSRERPLLKDPFAVFSAPWFASRLDCRVVITVRHPAAFASSLKRLDWPFDFSHLLAQPLLMRDWLEPYREQMLRMVSAPASTGGAEVIDQAGLLWCLVYQVVAQYCQQYPQFQVVRHEDLSLDPLGGFQQLYASLGLEFTSRVREQILAASSSDNPGELSSRSVHAVRLDSRENLHNWKRRLTHDEINQVRRLTEETAALFYPEISWE